MTERKTAWIRWYLITSTLLIITEVTSLQYTPVALNGAGDGECALLLNGPGRSSSFDYNLNVLRGGNGFGYNGPHTCITYDAVNAAYLEARKRIQVAQPHGDYKAEDVATVGELLLDISVNLARTYGLSYEDIEKGLPLIDTSKTLIREICPPFLSNVECRPGKYRRFDGLCTNLQNPTWGSTMQPFTRLIGPLYSDGMTSPRISVTGNQLPLSRIVSRTMHPDEGFHDHAGTVMVIAWGQFIDHDYTLTGTPLDPLNRNDPEECCKRPPHLKNPYCNEIIIPEDDYFYRLFNVHCMDFVRGFPAARPGCRLGSRSQFNTLTGVLDANTVYGISEKFSRKLRSGYGGHLRMNPVFRDYGLKDLLPLKLDIPDEGCTRPNRSMFCFEAGEIRVNEQLVLTCMHTLMAREHNRIADALAQVNPHWDDETLFQEARRINIAEVQHITYNEFLPILLGKEVMEKFGLLLQKDGYWDGFDPSVNPNVIDAFAAAAYRFGHSLLPTAVERWSKAHKFIASKRLSDLIRRPYDLYRAGVIDEYFMGLMNQVAQAMDDSITQEVTNHLFKKAGARYGMDLVSFNMQRGREFGLPGYMEFRKFCGLPGADTFNELFGSMPNETIKRYSTIFEHPHDVDLWSGGVSERPLPGSMLGPTFACIIATQFSYSRRGDRFWYELPNQPSSFSPEQLKEIRKARLARIICDNTDLIDTIQLYPMVLPDHEINPRVPCRSGVLPSIDFSKWADHGSSNFHAHQPFTSNDKQSNEAKPSNIILTKSTLNIKKPQQQGNQHPYEVLFRLQKPRKNIKILPPIILKPVSPVIKNTYTVYRIKRNVQDSLKNITSDYTAIINDNITNIANNENITILPVIDQITEAVTVSQISGTPPSNINNIQHNLNYQPLKITSTDFKKGSDESLEDLEEIIDIDKLIKKKINKNDGFRYETSEELTEKIDYTEETSDETKEKENYDEETSKESEQNYKDETSNESKKNQNFKDDTSDESKEKENYKEDTSDDESKEQDNYKDKISDESKEKENYNEESTDESKEHKNYKDEIFDESKEKEKYKEEAFDESKERENYKEENANVDKSENLKTSEEVNQTNEQFEEQEKIIENEPKNDKLIISVIDSQENEDEIQKESEDQIQNDENTEKSSQLSQNNSEEEIPIIQDKIVKHLIEFDELNKNLEKLSDKALQSSQNKTEEEVPIIQDKFIKHLIEFGEFNENLRKSSEEKTDNDDDSNEKSMANVKINDDTFYLPLAADNEEEKEKDKYFDDIIFHQIKVNERLKHELEYPELDSDYEKYREDSEDLYSKDKKFVFTNVDKPYEIKLEGFFPFERSTANEYTYEDDKDAEAKKQNESVEDETKEEIQNESKEENDEESSHKIFTIVPNKSQDEIQIIGQETINTDNKKEASYKSETEISPEENFRLTTKSVINDLNKILEKKDAISRQQEIHHPKEYNTFWTLQYKNPKPT